MIQGFHLKKKYKQDKHNTELYRSVKHFWVGRGGGGGARFVVITFHSKIANYCFIVFIELRNKGKYSFSLGYFFQFICELHKYKSEKLQNHSKPYARRKLIVMHRNIHTHVPS